MESALSFAAVAETGSFTRAAERLAVSKAQVSKQVAQLERQLGAQLLFRTTRRLSLTEAGQVYLGYCRQLIDTLAEAERAVSSIGETVSGRLRITVPTSFGEVFMAEFLMAFTERYPEVQIEVDATVIKRDLLAEGYDLAIRSSRVVDEGFVVRPLGAIREVVVASPALLARHAPVTYPEDLAQLPCLVNVHFRDEHHWLFLRQNESRAVAVSGQLAANQYTLLKRLVLAGAGAVRLPLYLVEGELATGALVRLCPEFELPAMPVFFLYPQQRHMPRRLRVFIDFLRDWFAEPARGVVLSAAAGEI